METLTKKKTRKIAKTNSSLQTIVEQTAMNELNLNLNQPLKPHKDNYVIGNIHKMPTDYLNYLGFNRGKNQDEDEAQYKRKKVDEIKLRFRSNEWVWDFGVLKVIKRTDKKGNYKYIVIDGHHRTQAVRELIDEEFLCEGYRVPVHIIADEKINAMTDKELAKIVAGINDYNPRWHESEHVATAIIFKLISAIYLSDYKAKFDGLKIVKANGNKITCSYNWLYSLASNDYNFAKENIKMTYSLLEDDTIGMNMAKPEFAKKFNGFVECLKSAAKWEAVKPSKYVYLLIKYGNNEGFDKLNRAIVRGKAPRNESNLKGFFADLMD